MFFTPAVFCFTIRQIFVYAFKAACRDGHAAGTYKLEYALQSTQLFIEVGYLLAHAVLFYNGEHGIHLHDARVVFTDDFGNFRFFFQYGGRYLIQRNLMLVDFIVREIVRLQHIYLFGDLLRHLLDSILILPGCNGIFMYPLDRGCRNVQTLDIDLPAGKYSRYLIQQTCKVFRMNDDCI